MLVLLDNTEGLYSYWQAQSGSCSFLYDTLEFLVSLDQLLSSFEQLEELAYGAQAAPKYRIISSVLSSRCLSPIDMCDLVQKMPNLNISQQE